MVNAAEKYINKIEQFLSTGANYGIADGLNPHGFTYVTDKRYSEIYGWIVSAQALVDNIFAGARNIYTKQISVQLDQIASYNVDAHRNAASVYQVLLQIKSNLEDGVLTSLKNKQEAETFDDFLEHANEYLAQDRKMESGVIAGVVFEDTIRKICQKLEIDTNSKQLEHLINALKADGHIEKTKASRCKTASSVRGTAAHANWNELDIGSVRDTISLTRELISQFLEG